MSDPFARHRKQPQAPQYPAQQLFNTPYNQGNEDSGWGQSEYNGGGGGDDFNFVADPVVPNQVEFTLGGAGDHQHNATAGSEAMYNGGVSFQGGDGGFKPPRQVAGPPLPKNPTMMGKP